APPTLTPFPTRRSSDLVQFPQIVAGDKGRAAVSFIGTNAIGDDQHNGFVGRDKQPAVWHLYISMTYDGGKHWTTMDTTPTDPIRSEEHTSELQSLAYLV